MHSNCLQGDGKEDEGEQSAECDLAAPIARRLNLVIIAPHLATGLIVLGILLLRLANGVLLHKVPLFRKMKELHVVASRDPFSLPFVLNSTKAEKLVCICEWGYHGSYVGCHAAYSIT